MKSRTHIINLTVFSVGFFGLMAQTLLFRDFLSVFEGSEIATGLFFFSWLVWIVVGVSIGCIPFVTKYAARRFHFMLLLFIPAFLLQNWLLFNARAVIGIAEYELIPLWKLVSALVIFNSPVSIVTGLLFVAGAKWMPATQTPTAKIYILDAAGSFAGALLVTALLYFGMAWENIFLIATLLLTMVVLLNLDLKEKTPQSQTAFYLITALLGLSCIVILCSGLGNRWERNNNQRQWNRMLPGGKFAGAFATPQAKYLYGEYRGSFNVLRWSGVCETLPANESSMETLVGNIVQKPDASHVLVLGAENFALCQRLCSMPEINRVVWLDSDPEYPSMLRRILPEYLTENLSKLSTPPVDVREYLKASRLKFELIILKVSAPSSLVMNRYFSLDFYRMLKSCLASGGVVSVQFPGGENYMGPELTLLGASLLETLQNMFHFIVLKPGASSCFFACNSSGVVTDSASELVKRFTQLPSLTKSFSPENLYTLYDSFRKDFQMDSYNKILKQEGRSLLNSDSAPVMFLYTLLFSMKKTGGLQMFSLKPPSPTVILKPALMIIALLGFARLVVHAAFHAKRTTEITFNNDENIGGGDICFFVWLTSVIAMMLNISLMFMFQIENGTIYMFFGLLSALFMLGLFCGGRLTSFLQESGATILCRFPLLAGLMLAFILLLWSAELNFCRLPLFMLAFCGAGLVSGTWLPRAAFVLKKQNYQERSASWLLWMSDSLGGAVGGVLTSIVLLPLLGLQGVMLLAVALTLFLLALSCGLANYFKNKKAATVLILLLSMTAMPLTAATATPESLQPSHTKLKKVTAESDGQPIDYYKVIDLDGKPAGYIFYSKDFVKNVKSYAGPVEILMLTSPTGKLLNFAVLESLESPDFLKRTLKHQPELLNKNVFSDKTGFKPDTVTGATFTSSAIVKTLNLAGEKFSALISGKTELKTSTPVTAPSVPPPGGPRKINSATYQKLINNHELSSREAQYYRALK